MLINLNYFKELIAVGGGQSSGRFAFLFSVLVSNAAVWWTWVFLCVWNRALIDIPGGVYAALAISNSVAFTGKVAQSFAEKMYQPSPNLDPQQITPPIVDPPK